MYLSAVQIRLLKEHNLFDSIMTHEEVINDFKNIQDIINKIYSDIFDYDVSLIDIILEASQINKLEKIIAFCINRGFKLVTDDNNNVKLGYNVQNNFYTITIDLNAE